MGKLIIITGPQGCGKTTYAWKNHPDAYILDYDSNNLFWKIKTLLKRNKQVVVCCLPIDINEVLKPSKFDEYKIITLNSKGEVVQICGRGFRATERLKLKTNEQQLSFHRSEVERIEKLIEEENKPKVGDFLSIKVTEQNRNQLIKLLEDECRKNL